MELIDIVYFIIIPIVSVILLLVVFIVFKNLQKRKYIQQRNEANNELIICLGGRENIIEAKATGSRLALVLKDYNLVNETRLKELGVSSILKMSNKITLVIGEEAKDIFNLINS